MENSHEIIKNVAFEDLRFKVIWSGYYEGNEKLWRVQEKCGFKFHHKEFGKLVPLMNDFRTEHFTKLLREDFFTVIVKFRK